MLTDNQIYPYSRWGVAKKAPYQFFPYNFYKRRN